MKIMELYIDVLRTSSRVNFMEMNKLLSTQEIDKNIIKQQNLKLKLHLIVFSVQALKRVHFQIKFLLAKNLNS